MAQQIPQALHDRETEAKATAPFARGIADLMVLLEDRLKFLGRDADTGVPDLDAQKFLGADDNRAAPYRSWCILVRSQAVADHLLEQTRIAVYRKPHETTRKVASVLAHDR